MVNMTFFRKWYGYLTPVSQGAVVVDQNVPFSNPFVWLLSWHIGHIEGILPKGPYLPCVSMVGRAPLAGYHRYIRWMSLHWWYFKIGLGAGVLSRCTKTLFWPILNRFHQVKFRKWATLCYIESMTVKSWSDIWFCMIAAPRGRVIWKWLYWTEMSVISYI